MKQLALVLAVLALLLGLAYTLHAATDPALPVLTELQQARLDARVLAYQLAEAQLNLELAQLQRPGYTFSLQTRAYTPRPPPAEKSEPHVD